jgi:hypothetical protein
MRTEAEVAQGLLASAGIDAWIAADDAGGAFPFALSGGARVLVEESDLGAAVNILAGKTATAPTVCRHGTSGGRMHGRRTGHVSSPQSFGAAVLAGKWSSLADQPANGAVARPRRAETRYRTAPTAM